jgi:hypothetical protein
MALTARDTVSSVQLLMAAGWLPSLPNPVFPTGWEPDSVLVPRVFLRDKWTSGVGPDRPSSTLTVKSLA